ncbi:MAG: anthraniloyl-CoA monooxygenase [Acidobacteriota bacterium]|jgi:anthraniloyl-CoA monooxygenase|nr:anthraniloyl-CoA monooxygenase [Acidobacteriota bacterium]
MKINIIGGGPAGLYFALLMKKQNPAHVITLMERNAPDDTFGWGVVFSDKTLSYLKETDEESYAQITASFEMWDNVDVVHRGQKITIRGNRFSGIARIKLLQILQHRCRQLGVDLRFRAEVSDIDALAADSDLLVGADGINSAVRQRYSEFFAPRLSAGKNKYIWYGTNQLFHGLTLTFHESKAGVFAAHSYKFNRTTSTFIVECDAETWTSAGFEKMPDEETRRYLAEVFRDDLGGHPLLSNNSKWINFVNVRNEHWSHEKIVLLGDALHTAHFSIGSGTKLALEDSIALYNCFQSSKGVKEALREFERRRKPIIEEYQEAAHESLLWFENAGNYMHLEPLPFAYSLMTRSKKIDYENLKRRDPQFIAAYEAASI